MTKTSRDSTKPGRFWPGVVPAAVVPAAACSGPAPAELTDAGGRPVPDQVASIYRGLKHCDTTRVTYVMLGDRQYVGDPDKKTPDAPWRAAYADRVAVPGDARDTGYRSGALRVFVAADGSAVYLVRSDGQWAKRLPKAPYAMGCD